LWGAAARRRGVRRHCAQTKEELHVRAEDLEQRLWEISDATRDAAEAEHAAIAEGSAVGDYVRALGPAVGALMQEEVSRFQECAALLADFHAARAGHALPSEPPAPLNVVAGLLDEAEGRAGDVEVTNPPPRGDMCVRFVRGGGDMCV